MDEPQKILAEYMEGKLREANEWLICNYPGDCREIPDALAKLYDIDMDFKAWLVEEICDITYEPGFDEEVIDPPDGYIDEHGDWIAYPWGEEA